MEIKEYRYLLIPVVLLKHSCNDDAKDCMMGNCGAFQSHGLSETDFITESIF